MPHDEAEIEDPHELVGVAVAEGDLDAMARTFVEEYVRTGSSDEELWRMFRSSFYAALHRILQTRGEPYVAALIDDVRAQWGTWRAMP